MKVIYLWILIFLVGCSSGVLSVVPTSSACPVTIANGSQPLGESSGSLLYHGNGVIWTALPPDGKLFIVPDEDGSLQIKFPWWRAVHGALTIQGRRLDASAPPLQAIIPEGYGDSGFQASGLIFPTEGCWEVTGKVADQELRFVVTVQAVDEYPATP